MVISNHEVSTQREVKPMNNIASERVKHNLTQEDLAERLGVVSRTIRSWEKDETSVPSSKACEMAQMFGCSVDYLFGLTDERLSTA